MHMCMMYRKDDIRYYLVRKKKVKEVMTSLQILITPQGHVKLEGDHNFVLRGHRYKNSVTFDPNSYRLTTVTERLQNLDDIPIKETSKTPCLVCLCNKPIAIYTPCHHCLCKACATANIPGNTRKLCDICRHPVNHVDTYFRLKQPQQ